MTDAADSSFVVRVAGRRLAVRGGRELDAIRPALAGIIEPGETASPSDTVLRLASAPDPAAEIPWSRLATGSHRGPDGELAVIRRGPSSVEQYRPGPDPLLRLDASRAALASGDLRAQPAHHALAAWLSGPTVQMVHAGAVARDGRGVLFIGVGGRGKTTTALACARAGCQFLGDDLCVVEAGDREGTVPPRIHGIYASAKLTADSQRRLEACDWPSLGITPSGKAAVAIPDAIEFGRSARLVAIVAVKGGTDGFFQPQRVAPRAAIHLLGSTALPIASGSGSPRDWLSTASALIREVPAYELGLGWDLERVTGAILELLGPPGNRP
jgi:hypothetical protein